MEKAIRIVGATALFSLVIASGAQPVIQWQRCLGGSGIEYANAIQRTGDGGYIVAGNTNSQDGDVSGLHGFSMDAWVIKLGGDGTLQWQVALGGTGDEDARAVRQTMDGGYIMAGYAAGYPNGANGDVGGYHGGVKDAWVVKLSPAGAVEWTKCLGGLYEEVANAVVQTDDLGFLVAGYTSSVNGDVAGNHGSSDAWVVKLSASGAVEWQRCLGGTQGDQANAMERTGDGGYLLAGWTESNDGDVSGHHGWSQQDAWVVKLDAAAGIQWQRCLGGTSADLAYAIAPCTDGGCAMAGVTQSNDGDVSGFHGPNGGWAIDAWVVKLNSSGSMEWQKCLGGSTADDAHAIKQTTDDGFAINGSTGSSDGDVSGLLAGEDVWTVKLGGNGAIQWQKCLGGGSVDNGSGIVEVGAGEYVLAGTTSSPDWGDVSGNHGLSDIWVLKLVPGGAGIREGSSTAFTLVPNPAKTEVTITFPEDAQPVRASLIDATGRMVRAVEIHRSPGPLTFSLSQASEGLYLLQVEYANGTRWVDHLAVE